MKYKSPDKGAGEESKAHEAKESKGKESKEKYIGKSKSARKFTSKTKF